MSGHYARAELASSPEESGGGGEEVPEVILAVLWLLAVVAVVGGIGRRREGKRCLGARDSVAATLTHTKPACTDRQARWNTKALAFSGAGHTRDTFR